MDDTFGSDKAEQDTRLAVAPNRIRDAGVTLNIYREMRVSEDKTTSLGHVIGHQGFHADPEKTSATQRLSSPINIIEL